MQHVRSSAVLLRCRTGKIIRNDPIGDLAQLPLPRNVRPLQSSRAAQNDGREEHSQRACVRCARIASTPRWFASLSSPVHPHNTTVSHVMSFQIVAMAPQTVPNCQVLHKNAFNAYTARACENAKDVPLAECVAFIEHCRTTGTKVLVYCMTGTSRAPAAVIAYLMRHVHWSLSERCARSQSRGVPCVVYPAAQTQKQSLVRARVVVIS